MHPSITESNGLPSVQVMAARRRGRTESLRSLRRHLSVVSQDASEFGDRPRTRGECIGGPRPCPFVACSHNLFVDVSELGSLKFPHADREPEDVPPEWSCSLDVADRGGASRVEVARALNLTTERVRQICDDAFSKLREVTLVSELAAHAGVEQAEDEPGAEEWAAEVLSHVRAGAPLVEACALAGEETTMAKREKIEETERHVAPSREEAIAAAEIELTGPNAGRRKQPEPPREEGVRSFSVVLAQCEDGALHAELSEKLVELSTSLSRHAESFGTAKGSLALTLTFSMDALGTTTIASDIKVKEPKAGRPKSVFWLTKANNLINENPRQTKLPLHEVPSARGPAREV